MESLKFIEMKIFIKESHQDEIEELAETIKDNIMDYDEELLPISDITYEIKDSKIKDGRWTGDINSETMYGNKDNYGDKTK